MNILLFGGYQTYSFAPHWLGQREAYHNLGHRVRCLDLEEQHFDFTILDDFTPDLIVYGLASIFQTNLWIELSNRFPNTTKIFWYCDYADYVRNGANYLLNLGDISQHVSAMFLSNREQCEFYSNLFHVPVHYMPQAALRRQQKPVVNCNKFDVIFVGTLNSTRVHQDRLATIQYIRNAGFKVDCFPNESISEKQCYLTLDQIIPSSKVVIGSSFVNDKDLYTSNRLFLTLGNNGFYLCHYFKNMEEIWEPGRHLDIYHSLPELTEKVQFYLSHPAEREAIREQGYYYVQNRHTYEHRCKNILDIIAGNADGFFGWRP